MKTFCYDIECFKNLFTVIFVNSEDDTDKKTFCIGLGRNDINKLKAFLKNEMILVGYNSIYYDDPMLRFLEEYKGGMPEDALFQFSKSLISPNARHNKSLIRFKYPRRIKYAWHPIDLMAILGLHNRGISLKQISINLRWHKIQDLPLDPVKSVDKDKLNLILEYNLNDVLITKALYEALYLERNLRRELSKLYRIDLMSASDSKMANLLLEHFYKTKLNIGKVTLKDMRTDRLKVLVGDCISPYIYFETPELQEVLARFSATYLYETARFSYKEKIYFAGCEFSLGIGGLHSRDKPGKFISDEEILIQDMDVVSYYPNMIINGNFSPEHLGKTFIDILRILTEERISAKKAGNKIKADGLKITINSIFGKLGYKYFWLYDPKQFISTTVNGQLGLLMLIEKLHLAGIKVLSANTDGVICAIQRDKLPEYYRVAKAWEKETNLVLEYTPYSKYIRRDVNSYITIKSNGGIVKEKGAFVTTQSLKKAYRMPIVPKALKNYFLYDIPVIETLEGCSDIFDFCISQKTGSNFKLELHTLGPCGIDIYKLQKTNRFYITKKGGVLIKRSATNPRREIGLYVGERVYILNDYYEKTTFEEYDVDIGFYYKEVMKIINEIEPLQQKFEFMGKI